MTSKKLEQAHAAVAKLSAPDRKDGAGEWRSHLAPFFEAMDKRAFVRVHVGRNKIEVITSLTVQTHIDNKAVELHRLYESEGVFNVKNPQQLMHTHVASLMDGPRTYKLVEGWRRDYLTLPIKARVKLIERACKKVGLKVRSVQVSNARIWDPEAGGALTTTPFDILRSHNFQLVVKIERSRLVPDELFDAVHALESEHRSRISKRIDKALIDLDGLSQAIEDGKSPVGEQLRVLNLLIERFKSDVNKL